MNNLIKTIHPVKSSAKAEGGKAAFNRVKHLPDTPGVYLFYNTQKELIYVGKATSLRSRVRSYFRGARTSRPIEQMIHEVAEIRHKTTDSVLEAVILEGAYIKKYRPKYNIDWRDDKSWNYIYITKDKYPMVGTIREHEIKNNERVGDKKYLFGPYPGLNTKAAMKILTRLFYLSHCRPNQGRPCFYRQLGQCLGVCTGEISPTEYKQKVIRPLKLFLSGKKQSVIRALNKNMRVAAQAQNFEEAARLRNQLESLERIRDIALLNESFTKDQTKNTDEPVRIEGYDISNLGESDKVGSMVVFNARGPVKSEYKKFNIKTVPGQSDVDCLREVLERRLRHPEWTMSNIVLIDGGLPQIACTQKVFKQFKINIPIVGIAKGPARKRNDFFFANVGDHKNMLKWINANRALLIQVRDEAHRFAIAFNRSKRKIIK